MKAVVIFLITCLNAVAVVAQPEYFDGPRMVFGGQAISHYANGQWDLSMGADASIVYSRADGTVLQTASRKLFDHHLFSRADGYDLSLLTHPGVSRIAFTAVPQAWDDEAWGHEEPTGGSVLSAEASYTASISSTSYGNITAEFETQDQQAMLWTNGTTPADIYWSSVAYGNGQFVAVSSTDQVMTSNDGITWTSATAPAAKMWQDVTFGNGLFVAVSDAGTGNRVMTSSDGVNWTLRTSAADNDWHGVAYGNGLFVAVGRSGTGNRVMTSPDGITWTLRNSSADSQWQEITYANGMFVAVAQSCATCIMTSPDGINWTNRSTPLNNNWQSVTYGNGLFVAVGETGTGSRVITSPDGIVWTAHDGAADYAWQDVSYAGGLFVAVAISGTGSRVMTSENGADWALETSPENAWRAVAYGNGKFVAVASSGSGNRAMYRLEISQAPQVHNYIRTYSPVVEITDEAVVTNSPVEEVNKSIAYFDGLGRPVQQINIQGSPTKLDIVQPVVYDEFGRESAKYMPYVSGDANGWYKIDPVGEVSEDYLSSPHQQFYQVGGELAMDTKPFAVTIFEASPLNRVLKQGAPGDAWQPKEDPQSDRSIKMAYGSNGSEDVLLLTYDPQTDVLTFDSNNMYYAVNELYANKTMDEHNNEVIEYVDKDGRTVCKKVQYDTNGTTKLYAETYYLYDDFDNLVLVLQPEGTKQLKDTINAN